MSSVIGIDLGGTKISAARYDTTSWENQQSEIIDTHASESFNHVASDMLKVIERLKTNETTAIGIGVPGLVRNEDRTIVTLPNIPGAEHYPLEQNVQKECGVPVIVDNDANCFALAESLLGAGRGHPVVVGITMGTGVGAGIVINGDVYRGAHGFASEVGHMLLTPGTLPYKCEKTRIGTVEQYLSGTAFGKRCEAASRPEDYLEGHVCEFMQPDVLKEVGWLIVNITHLLDPSVIVFGGSAGRALKPHLNAIRNNALEWILEGTPLPEIAISETAHSATLGAALLTRDVTDL